MLIVDALLDASHHDAAHPTDVEHEIATYLDLPPIPRTSCPRAWLRENENRFPALAGVARRYLGAPCILSCK